MVSLPYFVVNWLSLSVVEITSYLLVEDNFLLFSEICGLKVHSLISLDSFV